ncbi:MAG: efflux RND transporter periplasmic adaptor subunit [Verrucomicrobiota bacterium]
MNPLPFLPRLLTVAVIAGLFAVAAVAAEQLWTCGMHPQIIKKEPGNCPICGMALTPIRANGAGAAGERKVKHYKSTMNPGEVSPRPGKDSMGMDMVPVYEEEAAASATNAIHLDAGTVQRMNLKTGVVTRGPVRREIRNVGTVAYNEEGLHDITTKYEGWIEQLHVNATWTTVKAGDPLFEIYSPDLYNAQLNYVVAQQTEGAEGGPLTRAARARLQLFDISDDFIAELARTGEARRTYLYRAPADGIVIEKMAVAGQMMKAGERIYRLADLSTVWVQAQIFENDLPFVHAGQAATVRATYGRERDLPAVVALLLPQIEEQTRTATARLVLPNPGRDLRPGMFVDVRLSAQLADSAVLVPEMAVLRSGERNTVFLAKPDGTFEPREVTLGLRSHDGRYEVLAGLAEGDRVVTSGQFMLDSESQLREAIQKMLKTAAGGAAAETTATKPEAAKPAAAPAEPAALAALTKLAFALADASAVLAGDDLAGYRQQLPAIRAALADYFQAAAHAAHGPLGAFKDGPADPADLASAQKGFAPFSTAVADLARAQHVHHREGLHLFQCPMAPEIGEGRWLQRDGELKNPFFGSGMLGCGDELDAAPAKTEGHQGHGAMVALPPGHPPIDSLPVADYLVSLSLADKRLTGTTGGNCGGCGMSAAAMAAGEPCEHAHK